MIHTYKLTVAYDGTAYSGWQAQTKLPSVAQALNTSFFRVFKQPINVLGASRTDAGVHALGQVVRIKTDLSIAPEKLLWAWNNNLPADIAIRTITPMENSFNPFCHVEQKTYYYHFFLERPSPFLQRFGYFHPFKTDLTMLKDALSCFYGTHDFTSFKSAEDPRTDTVRTINHISLEYIKRYNAYRITIKGQKFLRHMIRRIVGASLTIASRPHCSIDLLHNIFDAKNPSHTLINAPAQGLLLYKIIYTNQHKDT